MLKLETKEFVQGSPHRSSLISEASFCSLVDIKATIEQSDRRDCRHHPFLFVFSVSVPGQLRVFVVSFDRC